MVMQLMGPGVLDAHRYNATGVAHVFREAECDGALAYRIPGQMMATIGSIWKGSQLAGCGGASSFKITK